MPLEVVKSPAPVFRWSAVFAGAFVGVAVWIVLHLIGVGVGLTAINPENVFTLKRIGIGTGIWSLVAPLIALFFGGLVAARVAGPMTRLVGALHGAVLWSMATIVAVFAVVAVAGAMAQSPEVERKIQETTTTITRTLDTAEDAGNVMLYAGGALVVGLVSAMLGASLGVSREQVRAARMRPVVSPSEA